MHTQCENMKRINRNPNRIFQVAKVMAHPTILNETLILDYALSFTDQAIGDIENIPEIIAHHLGKWQELERDDDPLVDQVPDWLELNQDAVLFRYVDPASRDSQHLCSQFLLSRNQETISNSGHSALLSYQLLVSTTLRTQMTCPSSKFYTLYKKARCSTRFETGTVKLVS